MTCRPAGLFEEQLLFCSLVFYKQVFFDNY